MLIRLIYADISMDNGKVLDISWKSILRIALAGLVFYIIYLIRDIIIWFLFALIISVLCEPAIVFLKKRKLPRIFGVILIYVSIFGILGGMIYLIAPLFITEIQHFSQVFPQFFEKMAPTLRGLGIKPLESLENFTLSLENWLVRASSNIFSALSVIFGGIFSTFGIFAIAVFLSLEEKGIERMVELLTPKKYETYAWDLWRKCQWKISGWFGARILACIFVGITTFFACRILVISYAVSFGFLAGVSNIVPIFGPIIAGIIITILTIADSWLKALFILITFILIQQIENNILTPVLTKKFIGLPSVLVLVALMVGAKLWGVLGAIFAIPLGGIIYEFTRDFLKRKKEEKNQIL